MKIKQDWKEVTRKGYTYVFGKFLIINKILCPLHYLENLVSNHKTHVVLKSS
jgi:hypothetical protein